MGIECILKYNRTIGGRKTAIRYLSQNLKKINRMKRRKLLDVDEKEIFLKFFEELANFRSKYNNLKK